MRNDKKYEDEKVPQNLTQMVIGEYLDRSEPNPFMNICTEAADHFMAPVYGVLGYEFVSTRQGKEIKSSMSFYKSFNKFLNAKLVDHLVPESERNSFGNRFLNCEQRRPRDGQDYSTSHGSLLGISGLAWLRLSIIGSKASRRRSALGYP